MHPAYSSNCALVGFDRSEELDPAATLEPVVVPIA
jgi:hypothetical protein